MAEGKDFGILKAPKFNIINNDFKKHPEKKVDISGVNKPVDCSVKFDNGKTMSCDEYKKQQEEADAELRKLDASKK